MFAGEYCRRATKGGFATKREALAYADVLWQNLTKSVRVISFPELWDKWSSTQSFQQLSDDKQRAYRIAYNKCAPLYALSDVRNCSYDMMCQIVQGLTYYPARDVKRVLNGMFELAMRMDCLERNQASLIELPPIPQTKRTAFTDEQVQAIRVCPNEFRDIILLMIETGMRPVEMRMLTVEDIDFDAHLCMGGRKANTDMPIALSSEAEQILTNLCRNVGNGRLCPLSEDDFYEAFYQCLADAGVQDADVHTYTPYTCRHTFVTRLTRAGVPQAVVQKAARHTSYKTTQGYTHMDITDVLQAVNLVGNSR